MGSEAGEAVLFGASGNTGRRVAAHLIDQGWQVIGLGRRRNFEAGGFRYRSGDIRNSETFRDLPENPDLVVNLAGLQPSIMTRVELTSPETEAEEYLTTNVLGAQNILNYVRSVRPRTYIYLTSHRDIELHWRRGERLRHDLPPAINFDGDHALYAVSKLVGQMLGEVMAAETGIRAFNLRLPMLFQIPTKPYYLKDGKSEVMPFLEIIRAAHEGRPLEIWGDPGMRRDYVHVDNLLMTIDACHKSEIKGRTFNIGTGEAVSTEHFVRSIGNVFSPEPDLLEVRYRPEMKTYKAAVYDISENIDLLGVTPILLEEMLVRLRDDLQADECFRRWGWVG